MFTLLIIIYIVFISLGLPDSLLGSAWPVMRMDLSANLAVAGYIAMVVQAGTIVSSLSSTRMILRYGTGKVTLISVAMTALALFGWSFAPSVGWLFVCAIPLGLGGGSIDAALNHFVAAHYESKHMNWLHCFWGVGATAGPAIIALTLAQQGGWRSGYATIAIIQTILALGLLLSLPLWKRAASAPTRIKYEESSAIHSNRQALRIPFVKLALVSFIFFAATEATTGLWTSSYLVAMHDLSSADAARAVSFFYGAITLGRFLSGILAMKFPSHALIRAGQMVCVSGAGLLMLPLPSVFSIIGIILLGFGTAPIFPSMLHETPRRFGATAAQAIMGVQIAFAYLGSTCFPPLFGAIAVWTGIGLFPCYVGACAIIMLIASERLQRKIEARTTALV
jgi:fucose permease